MVLCFMAICAQASERARRWLRGTRQRSNPACMRRCLEPRARGTSDKTRRIAIVLLLFLGPLATALLIGGHAIVDPVLRAAADAREANRVGDIVFTMTDGAFKRRN